LGIYRGKFDIIADILNVVSRRPKKTQIMYQANLSFRILEKYLAELNEASLICYKYENQCYDLTLKGQQFLDAYKEYSKTSRHVEKVLNDINSKKANLQKLFNE
jgi:predicted transcriptional regulator